MKTSVLPENILRCMTPEDRAELGQRTSAETVEEWEIRNERDLHKAIRSLLSLRDIEWVESRMDKRTTQRKGVPDFIFSVNGQAIAWEIKTPAGKLSLVQERMLERLMSPPNLWNIKVIRSLPEAIHALAELGV